MDEIFIAEKFSVFEFGLYLEKFLLSFFGVNQIPSKIRLIGSGYCKN